jgi:hypothetical protein
MPTFLPKNIASGVNGIGSGINFKLIKNNIFMRSNDCNFKNRILLSETSYDNSHDSFFFFSMSCSF